MKKVLFAAAAATALALGASSASAATQMYDLNVSDPAAGLVTGSLGTVTATENGSNLDISVALDASKAEFRYSPDAQHIDFVFELGNTTYSLSNVSSPFFQAGSSQETPFGTWNYALDCNKGAHGTACQPGWKPGVNPTSLSFTILNANLASLVADHTYGGKTIWFAADVVTSNGKTGAVGATEEGGGVPEPASWALMLTGFAGLGALLRRQRAVAAAA